MEMEIERGNSHRVRARLSRTAGQYDGDAPISIKHAGGPGTDDPSRRRSAAHMAVRPNGARRVRSRWLLRAGRIRSRVWSDSVHRQVGLLGASSSMQCRKARMDGRNWRLSEHRRHLHRLHDAGVSRQVYAVHEPTARVSPLVKCSVNVWAGDSCASSLYPGILEQRAELETSGARSRVKKI